MPSNAAIADPVSDYARSVVSGEIVAGRLVRLACKRHLDDCERGNALGYHFEPHAALRAINFFSQVLRLNGGEHEGKPFVLQPWQAFIVGCLFGWKGADGYRRFRTLYVEVAKGNGKSPMLAGIGLYLLVADDEPRAEIYAAATKKDQAMILFRDAVAMVDQSPALAKRLEKSGAQGREWNLAYHKTASFFRPISSDDGQSGPRPHGALIDEIHEHKTSQVIDMMRAGTKGRRQALQAEITNAGYDRTSVCWHHHEYTQKILEGVLRDESWLGYIATIDEGDDWQDEKCWLKANPNLGVSVTEKYLREQVNEALGMPSKQNVVKRLNFTIWTNTAERWLDMDAWALGNEPVDPASLKGRVCYGGLDLGRVRDLSALALLFPPREEGEKWKTLLWFWCPEEDVRLRSRRDHVPYEMWLAQGHLKATPGNTTDFAWIEHEILKLSQVYEIRELAYDRTFAGELVTNLQNEGLQLREFGQGFLSMAAPTAELERLVMGGQLQHGGNPILRWNASNAVVRHDPAGNIKPDKDRSTEKIDGIVALIMALGRALVQPGEHEWYTPGSLLS